MRKFLLVFLFLLGLSTVVAQNSNISVDFLTELSNDTEGSVARRLDSRDKKCALIKVRTPNLNAEERGKFSFQGDAGTEVFPEKATGELKLFLTEGAKKLRIMHDDYGVKEYNIPIQIVGFKTYVMEISVDKSAMAAGNKKPKRSANYVEINVTPSDAIVMVDDKPVSDGTVYLEIDEDHTLTVSKAMYHTHTQVIRASKDKKMEYTANLVPAFGWLKIESLPENGAQVIIDDMDRGRTPFKSARIESGEHTVKLIMEMYEPVEKTVNVRDNDTATVKIKMRADYADVTINTGDSEAQIYIDGKMKSNGKWTGRLLSGVHVVEAKREHYHSTMKEITCKVGEKMTVTLDKPIPMLGEINVKSSPTKAKIIIDGKDTGKTTPDFLTDVLEGTHTVRLEKQGCASHEQTVVVREDETANVDATLSEGKNVTILSDSKDSRIYVNDNYVGVAPVTVNLSYGKVKIAAESMGLKDEKTYDISENSDNYINIVIGAKVTVKTYYYSVFDDDKTQDDIYIDGKLLNNNPTRLALGKHKIETKRPGVKRSKTIKIKSNDDVTFDINTTKRTHWIGFEYLGTGKSSNTSNISYIENTTAREVTETVISLGLLYEWNFSHLRLNSSGPKKSGDLTDLTLGLSLKTGIYYKNAKYDVSYYDAASYSRTNKIVYSNTDIPLLLKASLGFDDFDILWIAAGPLWSFAGSAKQTDGSIKDLQEIGGLFMRFDAGLSMMYVTFGITYVTPLNNQKLYNGDKFSQFGANLSFKFDTNTLLKAFLKK